jgi:hypothetical protein
MATLFKHPIVIISTILLILLTIWTILIVRSGLGNTTFNYLYSPVASLLYFLGAFAAILGIRAVTLKSTAGKMLTSIALAYTFYGIANLSWGYYTLILKVEIPYPSMADIFFMLYYPFMAGTFLYLFTMFDTKITTQIIIESIVAFSISFFIIFFLIIRPELPKGGAISLQNILDIAYPFFDVVMVTLVYLGIRVSSGKVRSVLPYFLFGVGLEVICDLWFSYATNAGTYVNGDTNDLAYMIASYSIVLGIVSVVTSFSATPSPAQSPSVNASA